MAKEENIILPVLALGGLLLLFSGNGSDSVPIVVPKPGTPYTPTDFIKRYWKEAQQSQTDTTIPALFTITQGGLESNWGNSAPGYNFFGIKSSSAWKGATQLLWTTEVVNGKTVKVQQLFRAYPSARDGFKDHGIFFIVNPRYKEALKHVRDPLLFAKDVAAAGYATDPNYYDKLSASMKLVTKLLQSNGLI